MTADPVRTIMPRVSRALKNGDERRALRLLAGEVGLDVAERAMHAFTGTPVVARLAPDWTVLTRTEYAMVWNAACGLTAREVAKRFGRSEETIRTMQGLARRRLGVHSMAEAVATCYRRGIFDRATPLVPVDW